MDIRRIFFVILSIISITSMAIISFKIDGFITLLIGIFFYILFFTLVHLLSAIYIAWRDDCFPDVDGLCLFMIGFLLFGQKRIYYSDLGYFYMSGRSKLSIWKQGFFSSEKLFSVNYHGDIEDTRNQIKSELEKIYHRELEQNRKRKLLKDWNGYIDLKSERDDKLNKILN